MSREKQIKRMEEIGSKLPCDREDCSKCLAMNRRCNDFLYAERLYNAGYRKVSDVAEEIFAEIDEVAYKLMNSPYYSIGEAVYDLAELKKKYTEGGE